MHVYMYTDGFSYTYAMADCPTAYTHIFCPTVYRDTVHTLFRLWGDGSNSSSIT